MLALQKQPSAPKKCTVNILPCKIHHTGPAKVTKRHWAPVNEEDGSMTSYFRGRKLRGKNLRIPAGHIGVVMKHTNKCLPLSKSAEPAVSSSHDDDSDDIQILGDSDEPEQVKTLETTATFEDMAIWGHDQIPPSDDRFVKGVEEWLAFANAVHS